MRSYSIADIKFNITGVTNEYFYYRLREYECEQSSQCDVNIHFHNDIDDIVIPEGKVIANVNQRFWMELDNGDYAFYDLLPGFTQIFSLVTTDRKWSNINVTLCQKEHLMLDEDRRAYFALGEIMRFVALANDGIVIHSSAVNYNNNGILYSAPSGTGKSTQTQLWCKYYPDESTVLNDDMPVVRFISNKPYIFGTPWSGSTEINCNSSAPLKSIIFLKQAPENTIVKVDGHAAIWNLLKEIRKPALKDMMDLTLEIINKILITTPTYMLCCNISKEAIETVKNIL